ncbi:mediator of RNA polymerase II transcription subunit 15 isoform X2 [Syngnathoides biaculeatus]|nr:mediator of RNA polymerase II transcription subunit 15 isoform X2 [Syngnathoides biaculeatus]
MGPRPAGAPVGGMGAMAQIGQHAMPGVSGNPQSLGGPAQLSLQQQQQQQNLQFQQFQAQQQQQFQVQQQLRAQQQQTQQQQNQMHQSRMQQQQMVQLQLQQQQQHAQAQSIQHLVQQQQAQPGPMQPLLQQQQGAMVPQSLAGQMAPAQHVPINSLSQQQQQLKMQQAFQVRAAMQQQQQAQAQAQMAAATGQLVRPNMQMPARLTRPPLVGSIPTPNAAVTQQAQQHAMMSSPSPVQVQTPQSMPPPPQPSPQPPASQPNSASSGPAPSPGGFQPSPSPQPSQSPSTARTPQNYGVSSPGPLSTPGNPNSVMSPAGAASQEDQQYMEKLKQLSKYIEPLRRMINKIDKNEERKKDLSKMKSLLNILTDPNTRCPLKTLQKCEIALEKLKNDMAVVPTPPPPPLATKQQYLCQPLLDAVMANLRSPLFNHSLHRTFAPAMAAIHGPPITAPPVSSRKRKCDEDERQTVPNILQGEVARLDVKFLVHLDPAHCSNNGAVHLVCKLEDKNLPSVPPLQVSVPADYPDQSPYWADGADQYGANRFLQAVHRTLASKLLQLPDKHSLTEVLHTWAQSVRQACLSAAR